MVLPKIIYWYSDDFNSKDEDPSSAAAADAAATAGSSSSLSSSPSLGCLLHVKRYLTGWVDTQRYTVHAIIDACFAAHDLRLRCVPRTGERSLFSLARGHAPAVLTSQPQTLVSAEQDRGGPAGCRAVTPHGPPKTSRNTPEPEFALSLNIGIGNVQLEKSEG